MTDAIGIHEHPTKKLGRRPASETPSIRFADHLRAVPPAPIADVAPQLSWPMDDNDKWGDCVVAGLDHALEAIETSLLGSYTNWTAAQILNYYRTQNPGFDPKTGAGDNGMDIQTFLNFLVKQNVILGFAKVDQSSGTELDAAIYLGLAIVTGEDLTVAQQTQQVWDYVAGSAPWGGHCTASVGYPGAKTDACVTWGALTDMTETFVQRQVSEAWFIVTAAHVQHPDFRAGFDLESFAAAYKSLTGRDFPVPIPNPQPPSPVPSGDPDATLAAVAKPWCGERHIGRNHVMQIALEKWLAAKNI